MKVIKELLQSKKFVTALLGMVTIVATKLGFPQARVEELLALVSPLLAYVLGQGIADFGKGAAPSEPVPPSQGGAS